MPELRKDPIVGRWVIISTDRAKRPTDFTREPTRMKGGFCPFCAGNESKTPAEVLAYRPNGGSSDSEGWTVRVVPNKFPALGIEGNLNRQAEGMFDKMNGIGAHEVIVETPEHDVTLGNLPEKRIEDVFWAFRDRILDLKKDRRFKYILIFKNHGQLAGATLEHSHAQLIALPILPKHVVEEIEGSKQYFIYKERCVFCDIIRQETEAGIRVVSENDGVPHPGSVRSAISVRDLDPSQAARVGFREFLIAGLREPGKSGEESADAGRPGARQSCLQSGDPHRTGAGRTMDHYHWHVEFMPRLTKIAGFEWGTGFYQNPTPPEEAAKYLREAKIETSQPVTVG